MNNTNWDDLRFILAVAEHGSLNAASRALGVTHVTVMRRIAAFEEKIGQKLFIKKSSGYTVKPEALAVVEATRHVEEAVLSVDRSIHGTHDGISGKVRIASTDSVCQKLLPPIAGRISGFYPNLTMNLLSANAPHDLARLAADIAVRPTPELDDGLVGSIAGDLHFRVYCSGIDSERWLGMTGRLLRSVAAVWMTDHVSQKTIVHEADSFLVLQEMAAAGLGKTFLPSFVGDRDTRLQRVASGPKHLRVPVWVAAHEEMFETTRFRVARDFLVKELGRSLSDFA